MKDLGSLHFSIPTQLIPTTDRLRFLRHYLRELGRPMDRRELISQIAERVAFIDGRHAKVVERRAKSDAELARATGKGGLIHATVGDIDGTNPRS